MNRDEALSRQGLAMNTNEDVLDLFAALAMHAELNTSGCNADSALCLGEAATRAGRTIEAQIAFNAYAVANAMLVERHKWVVPQTTAHRSDIAAKVDRFLAWPLPGSVRSDDCATKQGHPGRTGTTLLTADEARQMLEYVLRPIPVASEDLGMRAAITRATGGAS